MMFLKLSLIKITIQVVLFLSQYQLSKSRLYIISSGNFFQNCNTQRVTLNCYTQSECRYCILSFLNSFQEKHILARDYI